MVEAFRGGSKVFVAGSSWAPDEEIFIRFFNEHKDWKLIIAPHVTDEDHLCQIIERLGRKAVLYTEATPETAREADALIIDCYGLLSSIYGYGDVAYVGGGFGVGIHNVLEAAVWGMPVIFGPNNGHFIEAQGLKAAGGGFDIASYSGFSDVMSRFIDDGEALRKAGEAAAEFVASCTGATEKILGDVKL